MNNKFVWGAATSSYQIEGGAYEDGKGLSIWDEFCKRPGAIYENHNGDIACDHYHRYREDVKLMKEIGIKAYRFSISWPRIIPDGIGQINKKGLKFYSDLIDELIHNEIEPYITLYHWDMPKALEEKGGFLNRECVEWFKYYTEVVCELCKGRVRNIMTFNEPEVFVGLGLKDGIFAPGRKLSTRELVRASHNILLCHGESVRTIRKMIPDCQIGYAPTGDFYYPYTDSPEDIEAAKTANFQVDSSNFISGISWWSDPIVLGKYPDQCEELNEILRDIVREGDMEIISTPIDFYAQNIYQGRPVRAVDFGYECVAFDPGHPKTAIGWKITPEVMYWIPKLLWERYNLPMYITENGMSCHDSVSLDGKIHDNNRIDFLKRYLHSLKHAMDDGVDIRGYFQWSLMDNFEWANGYNERFGLIYVDFTTGERTLKDSAYWYRDLILHSSTQ